MMGGKVLVAAREPLGVFAFVVPANQSRPRHSGRGASGRRRAAGPSPVPAYSEAGNIPGNPGVRIGTGLETQWPGPRLRRKARA